MLKMCRNSLYSLHSNSRRLQTTNNCLLRFFFVFSFLHFHILPNQNKQHFVIKIKWNYWYFVQILMSRMDINCLIKSLVKCVIYRKRLMITTVERWENFVRSQNKGCKFQHVVSQEIYLPLFRNVEKCPVIYLCPAVQLTPNLCLHLILHHTLPGFSYRDRNCW